MTLTRVVVGLFLILLPLGLVLPALPGYLAQSVDPAWGMGLAIGAYSLAALLTRPFAGRLGDAIGCRRVLVGGAILTALSSVLYFAPAGIGTVGIARALCGVGAGAAFTVATVAVVELVPVGRRIRAIGWVGTAFWLALSVGPLLGERLVHRSYAAVWVVSALVPLAAIVVLPAMARSTGRPRPAGGFVADVIQATRPGAALALGVLGQAAISGFLVLHLAGRLISSGGIALSVFGASIVLCRVLAGDLAERAGTTRAVLGACTLQAAGLAIIATAEEIGFALVGSVLAGAGSALIFPALAAIVAHRVPPASRGTVMGAFIAFMDIGFGVGGIALGAIAATFGYASVFWAAAICAIAASIVARTMRGPVIALPAG